MPRARTWNLGKRIWTLPPEGAVMGILNVTPDSFSDGGRHVGVEAALAHARHLVAEGADIIDVGGESTRPGSRETDPEEEKARVLPVLQAIRAAFPQLPISIDTRHVAVAEAALHEGADIINDITGLADPAMRALCAQQPCGVVLMHMQGEPTTMQRNPQYADVVAEVRAFFAERLALAEQVGIEPSRICLDPGIGFGKTTEHNLELIQHLEALRVGDSPLLMALSRKRFLGDLWQDAAAAKESVTPTLVMSMLAAERGADIHRVHEVLPLRRALDMRAALRNVR